MGNKVAAEAAWLWVLDLGLGLDRRISETPLFFWYLYSNKDDMTR